jgi:23S rRNA-/tRNA-specific pseudouridylate synthase
VDQSGKSSKTLFQSIKSGNGITLAKIRIFTGRTHQIRCHAAFIGYPIVGDKLYGQTDEDFLDYIKEVKLPKFFPYGSFDRQLLHASTLEFVHPETQKEMRFDSDFYHEFSRFPKIKAWLDVNCDPTPAPF